MQPSSCRPPALATWLISFCMHEVDADVVLGDLEETYVQLHQRYGASAANRWYWSQCLRSLPDFVSRTFYWSSIMLKNYLKIALRNLRKQKGYAFINVFGLAVGIAFCALIYLFIQDELTYDRFHENGDRIYRVHNVRYHPDGSIRSQNPYLPIPLGPALSADLPEVEHYSRMGEERHYVRYGSKTLQEEVNYVEPAFFDIFTFPLLQGNPATALNDLDNVVLSADAAEKYFGETDPMGKQLAIRINNVYEDFTVTGVAQNTPSNSTVRFDILLPFDKLIASNGNYRDRADSWTTFLFETYVTLRPEITEAALEAKLPAFFNTYNAEAEQSMRDEGRWDAAFSPLSYGIEAIHDIHLSRTSKPLYSYILSGLALAILLIACINFMTLAIGRSASRSKEVGIRKVVGAQRKQIVGQFWGEAVLMSALGLGLGLLLAEAFLPMFNELSSKNLAFGYLSDWTTLAMMAGLVLFTGLAAGSYPALILSGFKPVEVLKNRLRLNGLNGFTKSLVVVQFALSVFLIIGTLIMQNQFAFIETKDLGFDKEEVIMIRTGGLDGRMVSQRFQNAIGHESQILGITASGSPLGYQGSRGMRFSHEGQQVNVDLINVQANYLDVMGIDLAQGRAFDPNLSTDSTQAAIVNEAFVHAMNMEDPLGKPVPGFPTEQAPIIVGITNDFNFQALYQDVGPLLMLMEKLWGFNYLYVRIAPNDVQGSLAMLEESWKAITADIPFSYVFLDEHMNREYQSVQRWGQIINYASFFAVLIACLGLFGLVSLTVASRKKEIGVRKVLGAHVPGITLLLSKNFVKLVLIGVGIAVPAAYFAMQRWLELFAFRIDIGVGVFLLATALAVGIAFLTVSYQSIKAALTNPVDSLRYE